MANLLEFYKQRFGADPYVLIDAASSELSDIASAAGIDWSAVANDIQLSNVNGDPSKFSKYTGHAPAVVDKSYKGRCDLFSRIETKNGIDYPFINFVTKGAGSGSWSGLDFLWSEFRRVSELDGPAGPLTDEELQRIARAERTRAKRERKVQETKFLAMQHRDQALQFWLQFSHDFERAEPETGSHPYLVKKGISDIATLCDVRRMTEWARGPTPRELLAIPLRRIDGEHRIAGWQRIYNDGGKYNTPAVDGGDYVGACHVIGSLRMARRVCVAEGFASAASVFMASKGNRNEFDAVVMALSANNMLPVIEQLVECYPGVEVWAALDNDAKSAAKGKGNTGLATGIEILKKYPQVKCIYPRYKNPELCSDFNDLHSISGIKKTKSQLFSRENRLTVPTNAFEAELQQLSFTPTENSKKFLQQLVRVISAAMLFCPYPYSPRDITVSISSRLKAMNALQYRDIVVNQIQKRFKQKCEKAQSFRSFSSKYTDPRQCPDHVQYHYYDSAVVTPEIVDDIRMMAGGPVIVRAPMGSGKTQALLRKMMQEADRGVAIAHRVSLIGNMWDVLSRDDNRQRFDADILHYQDAGAASQAPWARKLTICVNSIIKGMWRPLMRQHDFLGFDEATQGLRATLSGKAMQNPVAVFNELINSIAVTENLPLLVDADANDMLVQLCELAAERRAEMGLPSWSKIHVVELRTDTRARQEDGSLLQRKVFYTNADRVMSEALQSAQRGEKFLLATDSKAFADQLLQLLRDSYPNKRWLYVSQDTKPEEEVDAFTNAPSRLAVKYDGLIYSPAISSGVSIEVPHFSRHYGVFYGQVVPSDAVQMLRRDRTATDFVIGLGRLNVRREESVERLQAGFIQALLDTGELCDEYTDARFENGRVSLGLADSTYTQMKLQMSAAEAIARNDFANNLICMLFSDGYQVEKLAEDEDATADGKAARKFARGQVWDQFVELHSNVATPSDTEREELLAQRSLTDKERAKLNRWEIENLLQLSVNEKSLKFFDKGGKKKIGLAELVFMDDISARLIDKNEASLQFAYRFRRAGGYADTVYITAKTRSEADEKFSRLQPGAKPESVTSSPAVEIPNRTFATLHKKLATQYLTDCGIDLRTGAGEVTPAAMERARDNMMNEATQNEFNAVIRFGGIFNAKGAAKRADAVFKSVTEAMGLSVEKERKTRSEGLGTVWRIDADSWSFVRGILERRAEAGISSYEHKLTAGVLQADHDISRHIDLTERSRSPETPEVTPLSEALEGTPLPLAWARTVLSAEELKTVLAMPLQMIRRVLGGLYFTEYMHTMSAGELNSFKKWQVELNVS